MSILARILATKAEEIATGMARENWKQMLHKARDSAPTRGFLRALRNPPSSASIALIAEIKRASPSRGLIRADFDPASLARAFQAGGATALSVLTDRSYFQGKASFLVAARSACSLPVLRKDFIINPWQVAQSRALGADCILLIMAALDLAQAQDLTALAHDLGMDALVEVHDETELEAAMTLPAMLIGINNRDLRSFETSLDVTRALAPRLSEGMLAVSESGIASTADVAMVRATGARAILVGESLMRQRDVQTATAALLA